MGGDSASYYYLILQLKVLTLTFIRSKIFPIKWVSMRYDVMINDENLRDFFIMF